MLGIIVLALRKALRSRRRLVRRLVQMLRLERAKVTLYRKIEMNVDNQLVAIKDALWSHIHSNDIERIEFTVKYLRSSLELWTSLRYAYKGKELCEAIARKLAQLRFTLAPQSYKQRAKLIRIERVSIELRDRFYAKEFFSPM